MKALLTTLLASGALLYLALLGLLYFGQSRLIFHPELPSRSLDTTPRAVGLPFEEVRLSTADGVSLHGWFTPHPRERGVILFSHGNAGNIAHRLDSLRIFHALGWSVLIYDYRGYGLSTGAPSERGLYTDAMAAWRHLREVRGYRAEQIVLFGRSLGAAVAAELSTRVTPAALILESAFTSVPDFAAELYPIFPARLLARFRFDTLARLERIRAPLLVVHSSEDEIIPFHHGRRLFQAAHEPKRMVTIGGGHNDGFLISGEHYREALGRFLEATSGGAEAADK